ncbi:MAG: DUF1934 domain-containing protein [Lachnospiraceae bacterium]|jgi:uncharacterized beta-barrel protein YwiB (DUF1934 family)
MEKQVLIHIDTDFRAADSAAPETEEEHSEMTVSGIRRDAGKMTELRYTGTDGGEAGITTAILFRGGEIRVRRSGAVSSDMQFAEGTESVGPYVTPWGKMMIRAASESVLVILDENSVEAELRYRLYSDGGLIGAYRVRISAK